MKEEGLRNLVCPSPTGKVYSFLASIHPESRYGDPDSGFPEPGL
jgi:hypothetical protein